MEGICVNVVNPVHFFQFLNGRCHGNQFCVLRKIQTMCDFFAIFTPYESALGVDDRSEVFFSISQGTLPWQPI